jgi:transcriptional regulator with PAS, ATPase and Fis domain
VNTIEIHLPPLRDRREDIVPLAEYFLGIYRKKYNRPVAFLHETLITQLEKYDWPGNIRELQHAIERAVILCQGKTLMPKDVFVKTNTAAEQMDTGFNLEEMERNMISQALKKCNGNITDAARELGLSRAALYRRMEKYNL